MTNARGTVVVFIKQVQGRAQKGSCPRAAANKPVVCCTAPQLCGLIPVCMPHCALHHERCSTYVHSCRHWAWLEHMRMAATSVHAVECSVIAFPSHGRTNERILSAQCNLQPLTVANRCERLRLANCKPIGCLPVVRRRQQTNARSSAMLGRYGGGRGGRSRKVSVLFLIVCM
jgi:hypothetical protein